MLTIQGSTQRGFCDGIHRRQFLRAGALGLGGLTLPDLLRARAGATRPKAVIMVCQFGGPSHLDTYDPKPDAPADIRGEFGSVATRVPGLRVCELLPKQAALADKYTLLKKLKMVGQDHYLPSEIMTGYLFNHLSRTGTLRPCFGSAVSKLRGGGKELPAYVSLRRGEDEDPHYLGAAHKPFVPSGPGLQNLSLGKEMTLDRVGDRRALLQGFDTLRRDLDTRGQFDGIDQFTARALEIVTSAKARDAFDVSREPEPLRQKYGKAATTYLQARRLVEAGVPVVTLDADGGGWDTHNDNFKRLREVLPRVDHALSTLIEDLHDRGLDQDVLVVMWGEFGRSPKISSGGRDHWPDANCVLFSGGGFPMGQVIGATDKKGERPTTNPYGPQNVLATIYRFLGIDPATTFADHNGRPIHLLDEREPIRELE